MKYLKIIGIFTLFSFGINSCENFLETTPTDIYNEVVWWEDEEQAVSMINGCYAVLRSSGFYNFREDNLSPIAYGMSTEIQLAQGDFTAGNVSEPKSKWEADYRGIGRVNYLLDNIDKVEMEESLRDRIKGEAYFLRAYFYHNLVTYFGDVPLILDAPDFEKHSSLPRDPRDEVLNQVYSDLDKAEQKLPLSYSKADIGRATKGAAISLKARVYLYEGNWEMAAMAAQEVIDLDEYSLFPDYRKLFLEENENNEEVIFDIQFVEPDYRHNMDISLESQMGSSPTLYLVNSYLMKDGLSIEDSPLFDPNDPYENRDSRLYKTIVLPGSTFNGRIVPDDKYYGTGFGFKKNTTFKDEEESETLKESALNKILIRYGDVLLMFAEATNEIHGPGGTVYDALNLIRFRSGMPNVEEGLNKEQMREVIRLERMIELAGEGLYYNDIRRWRTAEDVMNMDALNKNGETVQKRKFDPDKNYLWPIHETIILDNKNLKQNPGY